MDLEHSKNRVLMTLFEQGFTRAQLTMGALRHVPAKQRTAVLNQLVREELLNKEKIKGGEGRGRPIAIRFVLTEKGRKVAENLAKN